MRPSFHPQNSLGSHLPTGFRGVTRRSTELRPVQELCARGCRFGHPANTRLPLPTRTPCRARPCYALKTARVSPLSLSAKRDLASAKRCSLPRALLALRPHFGIFARDLCPETFRSRCSTLA